jgi:hypothetical protein
MAVLFATVGPEHLRDRAHADRLAVDGIQVRGQTLAGYLISSV